MSIKKEKSEYLRDITPNSPHDKDNEFPLDIFPDSIQEMIVDANETVGYHKDFFSGALLSVFATAIGSSNRIDIKRYDDAAILWVAIVGNSGDGKSHPISHALKYFEKT